MAASNDIRDVIQAWAATASGLPGARVVWTNQTGVIPDKPFITLQFITGFLRESFRADVEMPDVQNNSEQRASRVDARMILSVNVFADSAAVAQDIMAALRDSFIPEGADALINRRGEVIITVATVTSSVNYSVLVEGQTLTIASGGGATAGSIRDALITKINANPYAAGVKAEVSSATALRIFGLPGLEFTTGSNDSRLVVSGAVAAVNLAFLEDSGVDDLSELIESDIEARMHTDFTFATTVRVVDHPDLLESVEVLDEIVNELVTIP